MSIFCDFIWLILLPCVGSGLFKSKYGSDLSLGKEADSVSIIILIKKKEKKHFNTKDLDEIDERCCS